MEICNRMFRNYRALKILSILLAIYIAIWSYAPIGTFGTTGGFVNITVGYVIDGASEERTDRGVILTKGSLRAIVADSPLQMVCLGITRASAFFMYPALVMVFITKFRATLEVIMKSGFSIMAYQDAHELHVYCGYVILFDGVLHTIFHIVRWADQGNLYLLFDHFSGISGFILFITLLLICIPMGFDAVRMKMSYEVRKILHYFFVVFSIALAFHAPFSTIPNGGFAPIIFPVLIIWYVLDAMYVMLFWTEKIESTVFHVVPTGVQLTMQVSEEFQKRGQSGGYCYVCFPWIAKNEWHAYSLFENPSKPSERQIYIDNLGDWTQKVKDFLERDTHRPIWVMGPFSSPYDNAADFDNQILVAGGIGITPAISVIRKHQDTRRSNLIWAVRDPHMLEFFLKHGEFSTRGWNLVFYTGKAPLYIGDSNQVVTENGALVHIIRKRPDFPNLVPNIIYSIESGSYVPENFFGDDKMEAIAELNELLEELDEEDNDMDQREKLTRLINHAEDLGFLFTDLMAEIMKDKDIKAMVAKSLSADKSDKHLDASHPNTINEESENLLDEVDVDEFIAEAEGPALGGRRSRALSGSTILSAFRQVSMRPSNGMMSEGSGRFPGIGKAPARDSERTDVSSPSAKRFSTAFTGIRPTRGRKSMLHAMGGMSSMGFGGAISTRKFGNAKKRGSVFHLIETGLDNFLDSDTPQFCPWEADATEAIKHVEGLDKKKVMSTWGILYCGGRSPLATATKATANKYHVSLEMESFAW